MSAPPRAAADPRRGLPSVDQLMQDHDVRALAAVHGRALVLRAVRSLLSEARARAASGDKEGVTRLRENVATEVAARLLAAAEPSLVRVLNATGVVIHTNLGRAPLPAEAAARVTEIATGYSNLEFDLEAGERGDREAHAEGRLQDLVGAEAAVVVNNNAAAVLLAVNTLAEGREVLVSRGELVEIGGSFRIPDVIRKGGARLIEVGTTNRTRLSDYEEALGEGTGLILKVHPSNFRIVGFTESPSRADLVALGRAHDVEVVEDLGSGLVGPLPPPLEAEETVAACLAAGLGAVTFSGDKLLGGPQAGLVAGRADVIGAMRRNPLYRALRVDKMTIAALDTVLALHQGEHASRVPVIAMLTLPASLVEARARAMAGALGTLAGVAAEVTPGVSAVGGGAAPTTDIPTALLLVRHSGRAPQALAHALRRGRPAVVARVADDRLVLDLRTVAPADDAAVLAALRGVLA